MEPDNTHKIPNLNPTNYTIWYLALKTYAAILDALPQLTGNPNPPIDEAPLKIFEHKKNQLLSAVLSSVSMEVLGLLLSPEKYPTPYDIIHKVIEHINQFTKEDHQFLKTEAETLELEDTTKVDEYLKAHLAIWQKMVAARYPNIKDEDTTIDFIISGLKKHVTLTPILAHIISNKPTTIRNFTRSFKSLHNLYQPSLSTPTHYPSTQRFTGDYGITHNTYPSRQNTRRPNPIRRIPYNQLCTHHKSLGIRCNHTDAQCRDQGHPKYRTAKTQANFLHTAHPQQPYPLHPLPPPHTMYPAIQQQPQQPATQLDVMSEADTAATGTFILDSGAQPTHITKALPSMTPLHKPTLTQSATQDQTKCTHSGIIHLKTNKSKVIQTHAVANPSIQHNLISVNDLATRYGLIAFTAKHGYVIDTTSKPPSIVATATWRHNQYQLDTTVVNHTAAQTARALPVNKRTHTKRITSKHTPPPISLPSPWPEASRTPLAPTTSRTPRPPSTNCLRHLPNPTTQQHNANVRNTTHNWHIRLNHAHPNKLALTAQKGLLPLMPKTLPIDVRLTCSACDHSKRHPAPHKRKDHSYPPGAYVSSDTCGPISPTSRHGNNHMLLVVCAASKFAIVHFIKDRKAIPTYIDDTLQHIKHTMQHPLQHLRSDNAKEYVSNKMQTIYHKHHIRHHLTTPHQSQENSIAERLNRTIMNSVRALLTTARLDHTYWEDAARDTVFKYNLLHHATTDTSPYQLWHHRNPQLKRIFAFGQLGSIPVYVPKKKLAARADPARYLYPISLTHISIINLRTNADQHIRAEDFHPYHKDTDPTHTTTTAYKTRTTYKHATPKDILPNTPAPANLKQAQRYPDAEQWEKAHDAELHNLDAHKSIQWLPKDFKPSPTAVIPLMMLYKYKRSAEGHITQRKARCNLRGDMMKPGLHFDPKHTTTYTAVRTTQRMILALHASLKLPLEHFDIKSAYLHEQYTHHRPVFVKQMPNFDGSYRHNSTYGRLVGNLYGSPPAAYYYNHGLQNFLDSLGFKSSEHDPCLYTLRSGQDFTIVSTTIDDFLVLASKQSRIDELYNQMLIKYKLKRLGTPTRFLNWTIVHTEQGTHLSQPDAIDSILQQTGMQDCNPTLTPYNNMKTLDNQEATNPLTAAEATRYRQTLGELRYVTDSTRPDIAYATNRLAQHMAQPQHHHQQALKCLLRYLKGTKTYGLLYTPLHKTTQHPLQVYSDADFANEKKRKSISGTVHCINHTPISWTSKKQNIVALSTTEAEYVAATDATRHTTWIVKLLADAHQPLQHPAPHHIDNTSAVLIAENRSPTKQRKYIDIRYHFLQHHVSDQTIAIQRTSTADMKADIFTKPLHKERYHHLRKALNITPRPTQK